MAQPHLSQLFQPTQRPCWHCGTRHESNTMPALCSDSCIAAWQQDYQLKYDEPCGISPPITPPKHTNHGCNPEPVIAVRVETEDRGGWQQFPVPHVELEAGQTIAVRVADEAATGSNRGFAALGTTFADATAGLDALTSAARADGEQFNQDWLDASLAKLAASPRIEPRPADEPQDLADSNDARPPRPPEPPMDLQCANPPDDIRATARPWWRRWLRRG